MIEISRIAKSGIFDRVNLEGFCEIAGQKPAVRSVVVCGLMEAELNEAAGAAFGERW